MSAVLRARRTDPASSHQAAANAERFASTHVGRILAALDQLGTATADEMGRATGLSVEQCCRRLTELQRAGRIAVLTYEGGRELHRDGYRVWRLA